MHDANDDITEFIISVWFYYMYIIILYDSENKYKMKSKHLINQYQVLSTVSMVYLH